MHKDASDASLRAHRAILIQKRRYTHDESIHELYCMNNVVKATKATTQVSLNTYTRPFAFIFSAS